MEDLLRVGVIASTHGLRGEAKVFPTTDDVERFKNLKHVILDTGKEHKALEITGVKFFKKFVILKFDGIDDINEIEKYKGKDLLITREQAVPLLEGEFFIFDLIGLKAFLEDGTELGELTEVLQTGANDVFVIKPKAGKEILLPYIDDCVKNINLLEKKIVVHLIPGLVEE